MTEAVANAPVRRKPGPKPSMQAKNNPVNLPKSAINTADLPLGQAPDIQFPETGLPERGESIVAVDKPLDNDYAIALKFAEDPVTIQIEPSTEDNAPIVIDCWVNGKGAEVLDPLTNKWLELNCLPIGGPITTKRKYVEVLARSKIETVRTKTGSMQDADPDNRIVRNNSRKAVFSVLHDPSPKAREWLIRLMQER